MFRAIATVFMLISFFNPTLSTEAPTLSPSFSPSSAPAFSSTPTEAPSLSTSFSPSSAPAFSSTPTEAPTVAPSKVSHKPTTSPVASEPPTEISNIPSSNPATSSVPSGIPTENPSSTPQISSPPTFIPSFTPTTIPVISDTPTTDKKSFEPTLSPEKKTGNSSSSSSNSCFAKDSLVLLESGFSKTIQSMLIGDKIQVMRADGSLGFAEVIFLPHETDNQQAAQFIQLTTESGRSIKVTADHLVLSSYSDSNFELKKAKDLTLGSFMLTVCGAEQVQTITELHENGVYTAITADSHGHIVVNGVIASSFGSNHFLPNLFYHLHRYLLPSWLLNSKVIQSGNLMVGELAVAVNSLATGLALS